MLSYFDIQLRSHKVLPTKRFHQKCGNSMEKRHFKQKLIFKAETGTCEKDWKVIKIKENVLERNKVHTWNTRPLSRRHRYGSHPGSRSMSQASQHWYASEELDPKNMHNKEILNTTPCSDPKFTDTVEDWRQMYIWTNLTIYVPTILGKLGCREAKTYTDLDSLPSRLQDDHNAHNMPSLLWGSNSLKDELCQLQLSFISLLNLLLYIIFKSRY